MVRSLNKRFSTLFVPVHRALRFCVRFILPLSFNPPIDLCVGLPARVACLSLPLSVFRLVCVASLPLPLLLSGTDIHHHQAGIHRTSSELRFAVRHILGA